MYSSRNEFPIARMAQVLKVSESGYYKWLKRLYAPPTKRELEEIDLVEEIYELFWKYHGIFGSRKITGLLNKDRQKPVIKPPQPPTRNPRGMNNNMLSKISYHIPF